ncbi:hypothetical protein [Lacisediminimonas sp.]|uniref:hypothetical protein n=1 Tax=Lacisediminimonas sp. TaxID=3060582 RepID=UPI00272694E6|nr:hypothetical protein [Lacisediminimonas sp.]MDO8300709.1 hypothetical protein [Lacisediminimonas sp.]MDO9218844.1 hypothetical protein [Lacisediminimonas sp.]
MKIPVPEIALEWRSLLPHEAGIAHQLHLRAIRSMDSKLVRQDGLDQFVDHVGRLGHTVGCFAPGQQMVAYGVLSLCSDTVTQMAQLLAVPQQDLDRFAVLDGAAVAPEWRDRQLHHSLIRERMALAQACQRSLLAVTAAPNNTPSLRALLGEGFSIAAFAFVYGGSARLVLTRDLRVRLLPAASGRNVELDDFSGHESALAAGLRGVRYDERDGRPSLHYAPCEAVQYQPLWLHDRGAPAPKTH